MIREDIIKCFKGTGLEPTLDQVDFAFDATHRRIREFERKARGEGKDLLEEKKH